MQSTPINMPASRALPPTSPGNGATPPAPSGAFAATFEEVPEDTVPPEVAEASAGEAALPTPDSADMGVPWAMLPLPPATQVGSAAHPSATSAHVVTSGHDGGDAAPRPAGRTIAAALPSPLQATHTDETAPAASASALPGTAPAGAAADIVPGNPAADILSTAPTEKSAPVAPPVAAVAPMTVTAWEGVLLAAENAAKSPAKNADPEAPAEGDRTEGEAEIAPRTPTAAAIATPAPPPLPGMIGFEPLPDLGLLDPTIGAGPATSSLSSPVTGSAPTGLPGSTPMMTTLSAQILPALSSGRGTTEIALSPEELGSVRLSFRPHDSDPDRIVVMMSFERPEILDLFRRNADQLQADIRAAGYSGADLSFAQSGTGSGASGEDRPPNHPAWGETPDPPTPGFLRPDRVATSSSLDLRL